MDEILGKTPYNRRYLSWILVDKEFSREDARKKKIGFRKKSI